MQRLNRGVLPLVLSHRKLNFNFLMFSEPEPEKNDEEIDTEIVKEEQLSRAEQAKKELISSI